MTYDEAVKFLKSIKYDSVQGGGEEKWFITIGEKRYFGPLGAEEFIAKVEDLQARVERQALGEYQSQQGKYISSWLIPETRVSWPWARV